MQPYTAASIVTNSLVAFSAIACSVKIMPQLSTRQTCAANLADNKATPSHADHTLALVPSNAIPLSLIDMAVFASDFFSVALEWAPNEIKQES